MASRSVALVNRLRLGEAPSAADCVLAARLLALDAAAGELVELYDDLLATLQAGPSARKLRIRLALLIETSRQLESAIEALLPALFRYFAARADVEAAEDASEAEADTETSEQPPSEATAGALAVALADLAVPASVREGIDLAASLLAEDCRRLRSGLADLIQAEPDIDLALDFLSAVEADMQEALDQALRTDYADGEAPYRPGLADLAGMALSDR